MVLKCINITSFLENVWECLQTSNININSHLLEILGIPISFESGDITRVSELKL